MNNNYQAEEIVFRKHRLKSESVLVLLCTLVMLLVILAITLVQNAAGVSMPWIQFVVFVLTVVVCFFLFRRHITRWRYCLEEETFTAQRLIDRKETVLCEIRFRDMESIGKFQDRDKGIPLLNASGARKAESLVIRYRDGGALKAVCISPTEDIRAQLERNLAHARRSEP